MELYARVKPYAPKQGHLTQNVHHRGNVFRGGPRPLWYRINTDVAVEMRAMLQDSGAPMFDVVSAEEKAAVDQVEEHRHLVAMGMMAATINPGRAPNPVDLRAVPVTRPSPAPFNPQATFLGHATARAAAIPEVARTAALYTPNDTGGDLSTDDLKAGSSSHETE